MEDNKTIKNIEVGKFYFIHDGTKTGHPGLVIWKDDENNRYKVIRFDSDKFDDVPKIDRGIRHITKLSVPTSKSVLNSYVHNRPMLCKRKDIGGAFSDLSVAEEDKAIIEKVSMSVPKMSPSLRKNKK